MFRRRTTDTLKTILSITLLSGGVLIASCRKTDQSNSGTSAPSGLSSALSGGGFEGIIAKYFKNFLAADNPAISAIFPAGSPGGQGRRARNI